MHRKRIELLKQSLEEVLQEVIEPALDEETDAKAKQRIAELYKENQQKMRSPKKMLVNIVYNQLHAPNDDHYLADHFYNMPFKDLQNRFKEITGERGVKSYHIFDKQETFAEVLNQTQMNFIETTKSVSATTMEKIQEFLEDEHQVRIGYRVLPASDAEQHDVSYNGSDTPHQHLQQE